MSSQTYTALRDKHKYENLDKLNPVKEYVHLATYQYSNFISDSEWGKHVFPAMIRLQKLCNHPSLLTPNMGKDKKKAESTTKYKSEKQFEKIAFGKLLHLDVS